MNRKSTRPTRNAASPPFSVRHKMPMFSLGNVVATLGALDLLDRHALNAANLLSRHVWGDFGDLDDDDKTANLSAIGNNARIFSAYIVGRPSCPEKVWVITEADRSVTTIPLPSEY